MKSWVKLTLLRSLIATVIVALVLLILVWIPVQRAKSLVLSQIQTSATGIEKLEEAHSSLSSLPSMNNIKTQQIGELKRYADYAQKVSDDFFAVKFKLPKPIPSFLALNLFTGKQIINDTSDLISSEKVGELYLTTSNNIDAADKLMAYHAAVSKALINILEYNPAADTKNFLLGSEDTIKRLDLAQKGLEKTARDLREVKGAYVDKSLEELISLVGELQNARDNLAKFGSTKDWITEISSAQSEIISNRVGFWIGATQAITTSLKSNLEDVVQVNKLWEDTARKYDIT